MKPLLVAPLLALATAATAAPVPVIAIPNGTYHCIAGSSRMMLTLGDMTIAGPRYAFKDPNGKVTTGSYAMTPTGYKWTGNIGAITNAQIVASGPDATRGDFWFQYRVGTSSPTSLACQRM